MDYVNSPCKKDCPDRKVGCHSKCPKYKEYAEYRKFISEERHKANERIYKT